LCAGLLSALCAGLLSALCAGLLTPHMRRRGRQTCAERDEELTDVEPPRSGVLRLEAAIRPCVSSFFASRMIRRLRVWCQRRRRPITTPASLLFQGVFEKARSDRIHAVWERATIQDLGRKTR